MRRNFTHFVCVPFAAPHIQRAVGQLQASIVGSNPRLEEALVKKNTVHITLFVLALDPANVGRARDVLRASVKQQAANHSSEISLVARGVGCFNNGRVVFMQLAEDQGMKSLRRLASAIYDAYVQAGLVRGAYSFKPHITVAKTSKMADCTVPITAIDNSAYRHHARRSFGTQKVECVELNCISPAFDSENDYYVVEERVTLTQL